MATRKSFYPIFFIFFAVFSTSKAINQGRWVNISQFPFMAAIYTRCNGVILDSESILAFGDCFKENSDQVPLVFVGDDTIDSGFMQEHFVSEVIRHPEANTLNHHEYWSVIVKLMTRIELNRFAQPIALLPSEHKKIDTNDEVWICGFGAENSVLGDKYVNNELRCKEHTVHGRINDAVCILGGPCQGDLGGAMFEKDGDQFTLIGIYFGNARGTTCDGPDNQIACYSGFYEIRSWLQQYTLVDDSSVPEKEL